MNVIHLRVLLQKKILCFGHPMSPIPEGPFACDRLPVVLGIVAAPFPSVGL